QCLRGRGRSCRAKLDGRSGRRGGANVGARADGLAAQDVQDVQKLVRREERRGASGGNTVSLLHGGRRRTEHGRRGKDIGRQFQRQGVVFNGGRGGDSGAIAVLALLAGTGRGGGFALGCRRFL